MVVGRKSVEMPHQPQAHIKCQPLRCEHRQVVSRTYQDRSALLAKENQGSADDQKP